MKHFLQLVLVVVLMHLNTLLFSQNRPFPQQRSWANCIKPNKSQSQLDADVAAFYNIWKSNYLRQTNMSGGYYVHGECTGCSEPAKGTSEGHGYGMIITVLMAGYDPNAKIYFDGLYNYFDQHRSVINSELMSWMVEVSENGGEASAADGDMDIAYALLLAHDQWGSNGAINYLQEAKDMITKGIKRSDMNVSTARVMLGDWDTNAYSTRSSDWMTAHMRAYQEATGDNFWTQAANTVYNIMRSIQKNHASTGLMPDFVVKANPRPAPPFFLEAATDDDFSWNACRFPWRIAMDYGHYGSAQAKTVLTKVLNWVKGATGMNPGAIKAGYTLSGSALVNYSSNAFTSPILAASVTDPSMQSFLNTGWEQVKNTQFSYFDASINMLCMLFISGNWWIPNPDGSVSNELPTVNITSPVSGSTFTAPANIRISASAEDSDGLISKVEFYIDGEKIGEDFIGPYEVVWNARTGNHSVLAMATDDNGGVASSRTVSITVTPSGGNCNLAQYEDGTAYKTGDQVQNFGKKYQCLVGGWCSIGGPFAPGGPDSWAWPYAWKELGNCEPATLSIEEEIETSYFAQLMPNPFNASTGIHINLKKNQPVAYTIYNHLGSVVDKMPVTILNTGKHTIAVKLLTHSSGVYFCRLSIGDHVKMIRMIKE